MLERCFKNSFFFFGTFQAFMWAVVVRHPLPTKKPWPCVPRCSSMVPALGTASPYWTLEGDILGRRGQRSSLARLPVPLTNHLGNISAAQSIPVWISLLNPVSRDHFLLMYVDWGCVYHPQAATLHVPLTLLLSMCLASERWAQRTVGLPSCTMSMMASMVHSTASCLTISQWCRHCSRWPLVVFFLLHNLYTTWHCT